MKKKNKIPEARKIFREAFIDDPHFKQVYISAVAMFLYDNNLSVDHEERNIYAEGIIDLIFGE